MSVPPFTSKIPVFLNIPIQTSDESFKLDDFWEDGFESTSITTPLSKETAEDLLSVLAPVWEKQAYEKGLEGRSISKIPVAIKSEKKSQVKKQATKSTLAFKASPPPKTTYYKGGEWDHSADAFLSKKPKLPLSEELIRATNAVAYEAGLYQSTFKKEPLIKPSQTVIKKAPNIIPVKIEASKVLKSNPLRVLKKLVLFGLLVEITRRIIL